MGWGDGGDGRVHQAERAAHGRAKDISDIHQSECKLGAYNEPYNTLDSLLA